MEGFGFAEQASKAGAYLLFFSLVIAPAFYIYAANLDLEVLSEALTEHRILLITFRTFVLGMDVAVASIILGVAFAFLLEYTDLPFKGYLKLATLVPLLTPPYITAIAWLGLFGSLRDRLPFTVYNMPSAVALLALAYFPVVALLTSLALRNVDSRLEDAARLVMPRWRVAYKVTLPLVLPHALMGGLFVFVLTVSELGVPSLLTVNVLVTEVFAEFSAFFNTAKAVALSTPLVAASLLMIYGIHRVLGGGAHVTVSSYSRRPAAVKLNAFQKAFASAFILLVLSFSTFIPLTLLTVNSRLSFLKALEAGFNSLVTSVSLAAAAATLMAALGFFTAYRMPRKLDALILFPVAVPAAAVGIGLIGLWNNPHTGFVYGGALMIVFGYTARYTPFIVKAYGPLLSQLHGNMRESARLAGASYTRYLRSILLPLAKPGILFAWGLGFVLALRELGTTLLVSPPGTQTLSNRIYVLLHYGADEIVYSLSLTLVFLTLAPLILSLSHGKVREWVTSKL